MKPKYTPANSLEAIEKRQKIRVMDALIGNPWLRTPALKDIQALIRMVRYSEPCGCGVCEECLNGRPNPRAGKKGNE